MTVPIAQVSNHEATSKNMIAAKLKSLFPTGCKRILLVNPVYVPKEDHSFDVAADDRYPVYPPYGLGVISRYLQDVLHDRGYTVDLIDLNFMLQEDFKKKRKAFVYDIWEEWLRGRIEQFSPELIGLTCMFTITHRQLKRTAAYIKSFNPTLPIIAGGVHTSTAAKLVLKDCPEIDLLFLYEANPGFGALLEFVNGTKEEEVLTQVAATVEGQQYIVSERAPKTEEAMNIFPRYHDLPIDRYSDHGRIGTYYWLFPPGTRAATTLSNIGCRAQCSFCSVRWFNGRGVFTRTVENVLDELEWLRDTYGIRHIMWLDDDLLYDPRRAIALFQGMSDRRLGITWDASNGVIASAMTEEIAHAAYESGCIALSIGVESGNAEVLKFVLKPSAPKHFYRCMEILHKYPRIFVRFLLMVGFPPDRKRGFSGETIRMINDTVQLAVETQPDWATIQPLNLIPGVPITNDALENGVITEQEMIDGTERPFVGSTGGAERRVKAEKIQAQSFVNLLEGDQDHVPTRGEIPDVWWIMDYKINYERLWEQTNPVKLKMLRRMFRYIFDKTHKDHALGNLYFALIESRLGNHEEARRRLENAKRFSAASEYWKIRFEAMNVSAVVIQIEDDISGIKKSRS